MTRNDRLHLAADVRDLQIVDSEGEDCGIVDDIELERSKTGDLVVTALLVGPGAWRGRLPGWLLWLVGRIVGDRVVKVPWSDVKHITSRVVLARTAKELGLNRSEARAGALLPGIGTLGAPR